MWPDPDGQAWGLSVSPLYATTPAARPDAAWHEVLALVDVLRLGATKQRKAAYELLSARLV